MTTIVVTHEDNEVDQFTFDASDRVISIGRRSTNDVCIPNLSVSGMHARITIDGESALIEDNSSTNGTYVNGRLISRQLLNTNDEVVIGKSRVLVQVSPAQVNSTTPAPADRQVSNEVGNSVSKNGPPLLNKEHEIDRSFDAGIDGIVDDDDSFVGDSLPGDDVHHHDDQFDDRPMSLSEKAKLALGHQGGQQGRQGGRDGSQRSSVNGVVAAGAVAATATSATAAASRAFASDGDTAVAEAPERQQYDDGGAVTEAHPLDGLDDQISDKAQPLKHDADISTDAQVSKPSGAVIEIQNGAKSGQVLPIDKPVTTLGRPGIQIAAIMRKPDGYFLMHIESDESVDMPTLNRDAIGDDPVMLHSGDRLNVAGIDVEFMLS